MALQYEPAKKSLCLRGRNPQALALAVLATAHNDAARGDSEARAFFSSPDFSFWRDVAGVDDALTAVID
jgi:hypothetical protein